MIEYKNNENCEDIVTVVHNELFYKLRADIIYYLRNYEFSDLPSSNKLISAMADAQYEIERYAGLDTYKDTKRQITLVNNIIAELNKRHGKNLKYAMWLNDIDAFAEDYDADNIFAFETSDIILNDEDDYDRGCLYAYETPQTAINTPEVRAYILMMMTLKNQPIGAILPIISDSVKIFNDANHKYFTKNDIINQHCENVEIESIDIFNDIVQLHVCNTNLQ